MAVTSSISVSCKCMETGTGDLGTPQCYHVWNWALGLTSGTTANKADLVWSDTRTLTATSENLDVVGGLTGLLGTVLSFVEIVAVFVKNNSATGTLTIGNGTNPAYAGLFGAGTHTIAVNAGGMWGWVSPADGPGCLVPVGSTGDIIKVDSGAATISYSILVLGRSA